MKAFNIAFVYDEAIPPVVVFNRVISAYVTAHLRSVTFEQVFRVPQPF